MAITSDFANLATVTRASKKWDPDWDFTSGGTVGTLTEFANGVAAIGPKGLLVEESSTNEFRNPRAEGVSSSLPTHWGDWNQAGITVGSQASGTASGWPYYEFAFSGSGTNAQVYDLQFEGSPFVSAGASETFTISFGLSLVSGTTAGLSGINATVVYYDSGVGYLSQADTAIMSSVDGDIRRFHVTVTTPASTAYILPMIRFIFDGTAAANTWRIHAPQCEEKAYPTSPILPVAGSPAASTRSGDFVTLTPGAWFNSTAWSLYAEYSPNTAGQTGKVLGGFGATFSDTIYIDAASGSGTTVVGQFRSGGAASATLTPAGQSSYSVADDIKVAIAAAQDDFVMSLGGATQATDMSGAMPTANTRMVLGGGPWDTSANNVLNGYIADFRLWPRRLTNAELEALVGN